MSTIRWGLLSTARINRRLIPAIRASARGRLVAVASRTPAAAQVYATEWRIPLAFGSYAALLASDAVDAVYISLPNHLHAEWSLRALEAGKHVLCEKPLALSLAEVDAMIAASQATGRVLMEGFMYRCHPQTKLVGEWVRSGRLGVVRQVRGVFNFPLQPRAGNVRLVPTYGGGCLWDVGVYPLSLAQYILGAAPTQAAGWQWVGETGVDEWFAGQLLYPAGQTAHITAGFRGAFETRAVVVGDDGRLEIARPFVGLEETKESVIFVGRDGARQELPIPSQNLYLGEVEDIHAAALDGVPTTVTLAESRAHVQTVLALYHAAQTGQVVTI